MSLSVSPQPVLAEEQEIRWVLALHGGASSINRDLPAERKQAYATALRHALDAGIDILENGGAALDAVETVVVELEDEPLFNAGKGAIFTSEGSHELDASIMDGATLEGGGVAGVKLLKNPIMAARLVMQNTPHVILSGPEAEKFAIRHGCEQVPQSYFYTQGRFQSLQKRLSESNLPRIDSPKYPIAHSELPSKDKTGPESGRETGNTVGCVALDVHGNLAAATSTGGRTAKMPGRIGDSPILGAGNYADNKSCAVSGTGKGEEFIRFAIAARMAWMVESGQYNLDQAALHCLNEILKPGDGGLIAVDGQGNVSLRSTTDSMPRAVADSSGRIDVEIWFD